jgi:hypothetical protein
LHREVFQIQFLTAANGPQPRLVDAAAQREIHGGSRAADLGPEVFSNESDVTAVIGMSVAGEDIVGAANNIQDRFFVGFPFF